MHVLANKGVIPSAKILRDAVVNLTGEKILVTTKPEVIKTLLIRYGNSSAVRGLDLSPNDPEFIRICSDKLLFSNTIKDFYTPVYSTCERDVVFPAIIRETLKGSHGYGIHVSENEDVFYSIWKEGFYWTSFINLSYELRVHVLNGEVKKIFVKKWIGDDVKYKIRNNETCHFSLSNGEYPKLKELVSNLTAALGNPCFYGLDVGWDKARKEYFIIEANSAPGLNEFTANIYASSILERINYGNILWSRKDSSRS